MTRIRCEVPFCNRTTARFQPPMQWICGEHWRLVPKRLRRLKALAKRRGKPEAVQAYLWNKCRQHAIEAAMGIG